MSRTDKDRPYEVKIRDPHEATVEHHDHRPRYILCVTGHEDVGRTYYTWGYNGERRERFERWHTRNLGYRVPVDRECDIDGPDLPWAPSWAYPNCYRTLAWQNRYRLNNVPKWYVDHLWNNPERVRERDALRGAARAWNAGDDLEDFDFPNFRPRHGAAWYWD